LIGVEMAYSGAMSEISDSTEALQILPVDRRGRVRVSRERRAALLEQFDKSGMTVRRFAAWAGIKYQTVYGWLQRRKQAGAAEAPKGVQWVEAVVENNTRQAQSPPVPPRGVLVVHLPGGARMEIGDGLAAALAGEVLRNLSGGSASEGGIGVAC
jgi:transposase-like protein